MCGQLLCRSLLCTEPACLDSLSRRCSDEVCFGLVALGPGDLPKIFQGFRHQKIIAINVSRPVPGWYIPRIDALHFCLEFFSQIQGQIKTQRSIGALVQMNRDSSQHSKPPRPEYKYPACWTIDSKSWKGGAALS